MVAVRMAGKLQISYFSNFCSLVALSSNFSLFSPQPKQQPQRGSCWSFALLMASVWDRPNASGSFPSTRCAHTLVVIARNLYVFGGFDGSKMLNDLYIFRT